MERELAQHLLTLLAAFVAGDGRLKPTTIARYAAGDWRFFRVLEQGGGTFTVRKYDEVVAWFFAHWPDGAVWPEAVPRPAVERAVAGLVPADSEALSSEAAA